VADDVDEMLVLDMCSDDDTKAVAQSLGAAVVDVPIADPWDAARGQGLEILRTDYVLILDADEWAPGVIHRPALVAGMDAGCAIAFPKVNFLGDSWIRGSRWWPNYQVRLFPRKAATITDRWHQYLHVGAPVVRLPKRTDYAIRHEGLSDARELVLSTSR